MTSWTLRAALARGRAMRDVRLIEERDVALADIHVGERLRGVTPSAVDAVAESIAALGHMLEPVLLRRVAHRDNQLVLVAGGHRLAAAAQIGWEMIPAKIYDCNDDQARLMEVDENLCVSDLSPLEMAKFMGERQRIWEMIYPEARHGGDRKSADYKEKNQTEIISVCSMVAQKRGMSERMVRNYARLARTINPDAMKALESATKNRHLNYREIDAVARLSQEEQPKVAKLLAEFPGYSVKHARMAAAGHPEPDRPEDDPNEVWRKLTPGFDRMPKAAKRRFLRWLWSVGEYEDLLDEERAELAEFRAREANMINGGGK